MNVILLITACFAGLLMAASISEAADISGSAKHRTVPHNRTDIYFAAFFPLTPVGSLDAKIGHGVMPAVRLAIKHINQSPNILKGYKLHMYWNDTQCNPGVGLKAFFDMVHLRPKKLILFGAACSPVTDQIAKAARHWNLVQLTYADTHPMFTEKSFPHFYRVVPSENEFNPPRLSILRYYNWTRVGTLYQNSAKYALAHNNLVSELEKNNFTVVASQSFNDEITNQLDILIQKDSRILLGNFNETWARHVFCEAHKKGVYGSKFQWLIVGMYQEEWWRHHLPPNCSQEQLEEALVGVMVMDVQALASNDDITVSGRMPVEYERQYRNLTKHYSRYHGYAYDGVWAAALAIETVGRYAPKHNLSLSDFSYRTKAWEELFTDALKRTSFAGVTGPVRFKGNSRRGNIVIKQIIRNDLGGRGGSRSSSSSSGLQEVAEDDDDSIISGGSGGGGSIQEQCIGEYSGVTRTLYLERCSDVYWPGPNPPKDQTITRIVPNRVNMTIYVALCIIASLGIVLAISFLIINIKFRHQKHIKMSSPNLNNLIIVGCVLTYTSVIILGLDSDMTSKESFPYICTARAWILMSGFTLSFGSMFSKTWRVHSIFTNVQLNKKVMKDYQLYLIVALLVSIDVVIMTAWQIVDPFFREIKDLEPISDELEDGVQIIPRIESCRSYYMPYFVGCIYATKGLLMLFGAFLAWETRQVQIPALNDSKYVGMSLYNVAIMCVLGVAVNIVLSDHQNASFIIISIFIIFCTTGTLCLVFVPKIIDLKRDPHGTLDKRGKPTIKTLGSAPRNKTPLQTMEDKLRIANKVNTKYKELMNEMDENIKQAMEEIGTDEATTEALIAEHQQSSQAMVEAASASAVTSSESSRAAASGTTLSMAPVTVNTVTTTVRSSAPNATSGVGLATTMATSGTTNASNVAHVSFAIDVTDMSSSSCSDKTSSAATASANSAKPNGEAAAAAAAGEAVCTAASIEVNTTTNLLANGGGGEHTCGNGQLQRVSATSTITSDYFSMNSKEVSERGASSAAALPRKLTANGSAAAAVTQLPPPAHVFPPHHHSAVTTTTLYPHIVDVVPHHEHHDGDFSDLQHHPPHQSSRQRQQNPLSSSNDVFYASDMPLPPPPPQYNDSRPLCELEADLCRKLSCGGQCHSQDSLNNSGYSDVEEEDDEELEDVAEAEEEEEEDGYYHIMPRKNHHQHNPHGLAVTTASAAAAARGHHVLNPECNNSQIESHSCQTNYEDHATQTEDESEADSGADDQENLKDEAAVLFPPYDYDGLRRRSEDFSPTGLNDLDEAEWAVTKANSLRFRKHAHNHHHHHHVHHPADVMGQPQQPQSHVIEAAHHAMGGSQHSPTCPTNNSISNQNITNVDSIEILPIFHKLLEDKHRNRSDCAFNSITEVTSAAANSHHSSSSSSKKNRFHSARSCPDMSVRCDIVEYL